MISDPATAKQISDLMMDIFVRVDESVQMVKQECSPEEAAAYVKATANIVGAIVLDVCDPLYKKHPTLAPANWDE